MKKFTIKGATQKIIISLIVIILVNFTIPIKSNAGVISWAGNTIGEAILQFTAFLGDTAIGILHKFVLGTEDMFSSVMLSSDNPTVADADGDLHGENASETIELDGGSIGTDGVGIPNIMVCPEYIFSNRIAILDANFVNPGEYSGTNKQALTSGTLRTVITSWYRAFRNIAVVGLLSVLVYIGIRILISSTAQDKAKYKERIIDWLVGLCLVFVMHYIMAGTMMITENITAMLDNSINNQYEIAISGDGIEDGTVVKENLTGYVRLLAQSGDLSDSFAYVLLYIVLVVFTFMFLFIYLKRVLYMAFFTMIAPLVAMTYPLDKIADGKAQGFTMWFKEYMMNALIQPVHLILYTVFIGSAAELAKDNIIYAIVAMAFLLPAEKFIKKMFRLDRAETTSALGAIAGGALAMQGMQKLAKAGSNAGSGKGKSSSGKEEKGKIRYGGNNVDGAWKNNNQAAIEVGNTNHQALNGQNPNNDSSLQDESMATVGTAAALASQDDNNNSSNSNVNYADNSNLNQGTDNEQNDNINLNDVNEQNADASKLGDEEDNRSFGEYITDSWHNNIGMTPAEKFRSIQEGAKALPNKATEAFKKSNTYKNSPIINKYNSIPKPVRRAIKGVAKMPGKAVKSVWKHKGKIGRAAVKTLAAGTGVMAGAAFGIASGDISKGGTYAIGGLMAGRAIGNNFANAAGSAKDAIQGGASSLRNSYEESAYGSDKANELRSKRDYEKNRQLHMKDAEQTERAKQLASKLNKSGVYSKRKPITYKEVQNKMFDYMSAGITDDKQIEKGLTMEEQHKQFNQSQIIAIMQNANKISDETITDDKKRAAYRESVKSKYGDEAGEQFTSLVAEAKGLDKFYNNKVAQEKAQAAAQAEEQSRYVVHGTTGQETNKPKNSTTTYKTSVRRQNNRKQNHMTGLEDDGNKQATMQAEKQSRNILHGTPRQETNKP